MDTMANIPENTKQRANIPENTKQRKRSSEMSVEHTENKAKQCKIDTEIVNPVDKNTEIVNPVDKTDVGLSETITVTRKLDAFEKLIDIPKIKYNLTTLFPGMQFDAQQDLFTLDEKVTTDAESSNVIDKNITNTYKSIGRMQPIRTKRKFSTRDVKMKHCSLLLTKLLNDL